MNHSEQKVNRRWTGSEPEVNQKWIRIEPESNWERVKIALLTYIYNIVPTLVESHDAC